MDQAQYEIEAWAKWLTEDHPIDYFNSSIARDLALAHPQAKRAIWEAIKRYAASRQWLWLKEDKIFVLPTAEEAVRQKTRS